LDCLILVQNWSNDICLGCVGVKEKTLEHLKTFENTLIEEHNKLIKEQGLLKKIYTLIERTCNSSSSFELVYDL